MKKSKFKTEREVIQNKTEKNSFAAGLEFYVIFLALNGTMPCTDYSHIF